MQLREASFHIHFLQRFTACFSATESFHVPSRAFGGWLFCPQSPADAHDARPYFCLRHPQKPNIRSLDLKGGVGQNGAHDAFRGAAWGAGSPLVWWVPAKTRLWKLSVPESAQGETEVR